MITMRVIIMVNTITLHQCIKSMPHLAICYYKLINSSTAGGSAADRLALHAMPCRPSRSSRNVCRP